MPKETRQLFWMCYAEAGDIPRLKHWTEAQARTEAERLAILTSEDVFLLEATMFVRIQPPTPPVVWKCTTP